VALYFAYCNFVKIPSTLRVSPAMAAGMGTGLWDMTDIVALVDMRADKANRLATYQKQAT
jgi:hypothetical protein